jgi:hypothetical protein
MRPAFAARRPGEPEGTPLAPVRYAAERGSIKACQDHVGSLVSVDFFTVPTVVFKARFVFVVVAHDRRRVVHINVTDNPTAQWTAQHVRSEGLESVRGR